MAILSPPIYNPASISHQVEFITQIANPNPLDYALAELFVNGSAVSTVQIPPFQTGGGVYLFRIDFQAVATQLTAPIAQNKSSIFGPQLNTNYSAINTDNLADLALIVTYWEKDPLTNKPSNIGIVDLVPFGTYSVLNATRQRGEDLSLDAYIVAPREPYTNQPQPYKICPEENLFLTLPPTFTNAIQIQTFDEGGALLESGNFAKPLQLGQTPYTIGVGVSQLDPLGVVNITAPAVASYTVTAGLLLFGTIFIALTRPQVYELTKCCQERSLRIHFINRLGGGDAYTFKANKRRSKESKSNTASIPLPWDYSATPPTNIFDRGRFKIDTTVREVYEVEGLYYEEEEGLFIAELFSSPETYIETEAGLLPCIVKDKKLVVSQTDGFITASAVIEVAVDESLQTY